MTIHNSWGTKPDPVTGLCPYPVRTAATQTRLKKRATDAATLRKQLESRLDSLTEEFESAFADADRRTATRQRITAAAKTHRKN